MSDLLMICLWPPRRRRIYWNSGGNWFGNWKRNSIRKFIRGSFISNRHVTASSSSAVSLCREGHTREIGQYATSIMRLINLTHIAARCWRRARLSIPSLNLSTCLHRSIPFMASSCIRHHSRSGSVESVNCVIFGNSGILPMRMWPRSRINISYRII